MRKWSACVLGLWMAVAMSVQGASITLVFSSANGDWNDGANWRTNGVPVNAVPGQFAMAPDHDLGIVNNGNVANITTATPATSNPYEITVGNGASGGTVNLSANVTNVTFIRLATNGADADGDVVQTGGVVDAESLVIGQPGSAGTPTYEISGGSLSLSKSIIIEDSGTLLVRDDTAFVSVGGASGLDDLIINDAGLLKFVLGTTGINPIDVGPDPITLSVNGRFEVDGSKYEGLDGCFPLILAGAVNGSFASSNVTFTGFGEREPALLQQTDGLWLRVIAPPAFSEQLCTLVPASTIAGSYGGSTFSATRAYDPSGSAWTPTFSEAQVMDTRVSQSVGGIDGFFYSWDMRLGRGGHVYSFTPSALGETVPPSWRADTNSSPWNDEVWQCVAVDGTLNNPPDDPYFIHQSGPYLKNPDQTEPFYSPQVAACLDVTNRSFTTINWGQHAQVEIFEDGTTSNDWQSHVLYFTRYKDLGQGVIEASTGIYNYGPDQPSFLNMPWGGVRRTTTEYAFLSDPGGATWTGPLTGGFGDAGNNAPYNNTGGWVAFSDGTNNNTAALGMVFGSDPGTLLPNQTSASIVRWGYAGGTPTGNEADWRNYFVQSTIRRYDLSQGNGVWSRYYFVLGQNVQDVSDIVAARNLVEAQLSAFDYTEASTPLVGYQLSGSGDSFGVAEEGATPDFYLYVHPVTGSFPIYEIIENDSSRHLTWNPFATGVIKPYDGTIAGMRLLGFALRTADINSGTNSFTYESFTNIMSGPRTNNYIASGEAMSVRIPTTTLATLTSAGTNYPVENVVVGSDLYVGVSSWFRRGTNDLNPPNLLFSQEVGQAFTLTQPTLLSDLTLFNTGNLNATNATNNLIQLWIGEYSGSTPGATYVDSLIDMTGNPITVSNFVTVDFDDTWFPAGTYAFQMAWQVPDDSHTTTFGRSTNDAYAGGGQIYLPNAALPLPVSAGQQANDLVFALRGTPSVIWREMDTYVPMHNLVITQLVGGVNGFQVRNDGTAQSGGQSFTLTNETTLSALTLKYKSNKAWDTNEHRMKLWIGDFTTNASGIIPATTYVEELIDVAGNTWNNGGGVGEYFTFDFTDTVFPAGEYAFQVGWEGAVSADSIGTFERSSTDEYAGGVRLFNGATAAVPNSMGNVAAHDQVFILHDASYGTVVETGTTFPTDNVLVSNTVFGGGALDRGVTWFRNDTLYRNQYAGQSFNLATETNVGAITLHSFGNATFDGGPQHQLDVVIGSYDPFGGGDTLFQTVYVRDTVDVANMTFTSNAFYKINFTDVTLPAGDYAVELTWRSPDPGHILLWKKSATNPYALGGWLFINNTDPFKSINVPWDAVEQPTDLVFAVHEAVAVVPQPVLTISESGGTVTVSWTPAGGTLQSTTDLTTTPGSWSDVGTTNPYVTSATGTVYYRVVVP